MYIYKTVCIKQVYIYTLLVICESENKPFQSSVCCQIVENLPEYLEGEGGGGWGGEMLNICTHKAKTNIFT